MKTRTTEQWVFGLFGLCLAIAGALTFLEGYFWFIHFVGWWKWLHLSRPLMFSGMLGALGGCLIILLAEYAAVRSRAKALRDLRDEYVETLLTCMDKLYLIQQGRGEYIDSLNSDLMRQLEFLLGDGIATPRSGITPAALRVQVTRALEEGTLMPSIKGHGALIELAFRRRDD